MEGAWVYPACCEMSCSYPLVSDIPIRQEFYESMRDKGVAHGLAEMLALQQPPGTRGTDRALLQGQTGHGELAHMPDISRKQMLKMAKRFGVSISGKTYVSGLARFACDPFAWCDSTGDVIRKCKQLGRSTDGVVTYKHHEVDPEPEVVLADSIVNRQINKLLAEDPKNKERDRRELREQVIAKHAPKWKQQGK